MPPLDNTSSPLSYDTKPQRQGITVISRQPSIKILAAEVRKLKAIADFDQAEAEENATYEIEAIREEIDK